MFKVCIYRPPLIRGCSQVCVDNKCSCQSGVRRWRSLCREEWHAQAIFTDSVCPEPISRTWISELTIVNLSNTSFLSQNNLWLILRLLKCVRSKRPYTYMVLIRFLAVAQWLRHYATNRQVAGSIPDSVIGIFQLYNLSGRTMALGSTQPLTEMSTRCIPGGKGGRCVRLTTLPPSCAVVMKSGNLNFLEPSGPLQACNGTALPLPLI